jgi:aspartate/glutamate racemase
MSEAASSVGLFGGLGPESTIDYYRRLLAAWQRNDPTSAPSLVIDGLDAQLALRLANSDRAALAEYLLRSFGGTELPLLLRDGEAGGVPLLDTTGLHVAAIARRLRQPRAS